MQCPRREENEARLLDVVVGRLAGDDYVMDVTFAKASAADADKTRPLLKLRDGAAAQVAHARAQTADQLRNH